MHIGRGNIYWDGTTFPDATLSIDLEEALKVETFVVKKKKKCFHLFSKKTSKPDIAS